MAQTDAKTTPRNSLKEKQRQEREALILQAAEEVLMEKGFRDASMDEIAARVGIAKGTVYLHFPSKEDLIIALFARDAQQFIEQVDQILSREESAYARLEAIMKSMYGTFFVKRMQLIYSVYNSIDWHRQCATRKESLSDLWEALASRIRDLLEEGKEAGEFDPTIPASVMYSVLFSLLSPRSYERLIVEEKMTGDELVKYLGRMYFKGILRT